MFYVKFMQRMKFIAQRSQLRVTNNYTLKIDIMQTAFHTIQSNDISSIDYAARRVGPTTSRRQNWFVIESKHEIPALVRCIIIVFSSELILNGSDTNQRRVVGLELRRKKEAKHQLLQFKLPSIADGHHLTLCST